MSEEVPWRGGSDNEIREFSKRLKRNLQQVCVAGDGFSAWEVATLHGCKGGYWRRGGKAPAREEGAEQARMVSSLSPQSKLGRRFSFYVFIFKSVFEKRATPY